MNRRLAGAVLVARTVVVLAWRLGICAYIDKRRLVAIGLGNADDFASFVGRNTLNVDLASAFLTLCSAVSESNIEI